MYFDPTKMTDQATELRQLLLRQRRQMLTPPPYLAAIVGGDERLGATTMSIGLAMALASEGQRTVLADADLKNGDAAIRCGLQPSESIAEVVGGRCNIHEILQPGPAGMLIAPGDRGKQPPVGEIESHHLVGSLQSLGPHADVVLIDAGGAHEVAANTGDMVDEIILVTAPESKSVMNALNVIEAIGARRPDAAISLLVNRAKEPAAQLVFQRIDRCCGRILRRKIQYFGSVPQDSMLTQSAKNWNLDRPSKNGCQAIKQLAVELARRCSQRERPPSAA